jgi:hypothetical protein
LLDRTTVAWQNHQGAWHGKRDSDTHVNASAPIGLHVNAVLQKNDPYLWIGIADADTLKARYCYAVIGRESLRRLAEAILRYVPKKSDTE